MKIPKPAPLSVRSCSIRVRNNRARLVVAGLTVLRAYEVAGRPDQKLPEYGSFEEWSQRVRSALVWLGEADPCLTRARFKESDPEREALGAVLAALLPISDGAWKKCKDVVNGFDTASAVNDAMNGAGISCNPKALGIYLSRHNGRTVDGLRLDTAKDKHAKVLTFRVTKADRPVPVLRGPAGSLQPYAGVTPLTA